jgi:hypothetical protein
MMPKVFAMVEATFLMSENGQRGTLVIRLEEPVQQSTDNDTWSCPIQLTGLKERGDFSICGISSLHALAMSLRFVSTLLTDKMKSGYLSLAFLDGTDCTVEDLESYLQPAGRKQ